MIGLKNLHCALVIGLVFSGGFFSARAETLHLVNDIYPPYNDPSLPGKGIASEIVAVTLKEAGYTVEFEFVPWSRALVYSQDGRADGIVGAWFNDERAKKYAYSRPYIQNNVKFLALKEVDFEIKIPLDLSSLTLGLVRNYGYKNILIVNSNKIYVNDFDHGLRLLIKKRINLFPEDILVAKHYLQQLPVPVRTQFNFVGPVLESNDVHLMISKQRKDAKEIMTRFNLAYEKIKKDGRLQGIFVRHNMPYFDISNKVE